MKRVAPLSADSLELSVDQQSYGTLKGVPLEPSVPTQVVYRSEERGDYGISAEFSVTDPTKLSLKETRGEPIDRLYLISDGELIDLGSLEGSGEVAVYLGNSAKRSLGERVALLNDTTELLESELFRDAPSYVFGGIETLRQKVMTILGYSFLQSGLARRLALSGEGMFVVWFRAGEDSLYSPFPGVNAFKGELGFLQIQ